MPLVRGIRLLNSLETGNVSGACLETIVSCPARAADFVSILQSPGFACLAASSNTSTHAVTRSNTAMNTMAQTTVGACIYYSTPAFANNFAYSGPAFDNLLTSNDSFKHFSNSALTMSCAFATGTTFINCAAGSNTNLARMFTCPITACCIFASSAAMAGLAGNANIVSYLFNDPTAAACFSTYGGATAVCNAFGGVAYINYILEAGKTCAALACAAIGPYAFTNALSANCFIKNACALCVLVNLPACCALGTSCTFTCFAASPFGIPCATTEYLAGNTSFVTQVFALNACAQLGGLVTTNSFITCYYKSTTPFSDKFNCFWQNCCNQTCGGRYCCPNASSAPWSSLNDLATIGSTYGMRTPCMECFMTQPESFYYNCAWNDLWNMFSVSNNGSFMMMGGGFGGVCKGTYPMCICVDGVNYCTTLSGAPSHTTAKTSGFCVCCPAMLYSNDNGCSWTRMPGFCIPNTFFTCLCCDAFAHNDCTASCCGKVEIQWGLGSFTCCGGIWTGFRINNLCCKSHAVFGYACTCVLANNTPGAWTVCMKPHPFTNMTWCCGYFSGIGGECDFNNFNITLTSGITGCYNNNPSVCGHCGSYRPRFIMGKMTGSQPSVAYMLSASLNCGANCLSCTSVLMAICGVYFCNGCQNCAPCHSTQTNPFLCALGCFWHSDIVTQKLNPTMSFMTCVYGNTENMRAWLVQVDKGTSRAAYYGENIATHSSCTLFQWNCGAVCCCALKTGCFGCSSSGCIPLGGVVPLGNTILWMSTPFVESPDSGGSYMWQSFHCDRCGIKPFFVTCSQFAWGSSPMDCPEGYPQSGLPFTPCNNCSNWTSENCCGACTNEMRTGLAIKLDTTSNTFVAISCFNCQPSTGYAMYYNYPNAGNTALEIYGNCACTTVCWMPAGVSGPFCNIGATMVVNCSVGPFGTSGPGGSTAREINNHDQIPGCVQPAFCESFMYVCGNGSTLSLRGWPCAIVYSGSCCWNWGSTPCTDCAGTCSPGITPAMCCAFTCAGRCGYSGASYGWIFTCPNGYFTCVKAFGTCFCQFGQVASRFVCTANGMPSVLNGGIICGTGFYANGQTYSTCVFKLRFVDMF